MVDYNPFSKDLIEDPYPTYKLLRDEAPAYHIKEFDAWAFSRFDDIWNCSMDADTFSTAKGTTSSQLLTKVQPVTPMLNVMDPPQHTELRAQIRGYFQPRTVAKLGELVDQVAERCMREFSERGRADLMDEFGSQISVTLACVVNGIPLEDAQMCFQLVKRFFGREEGVDGMTPDGIAAAMELNTYFESVIKKRRGDPDAEDNVLNTLLTAKVDGRLLEDAEIASHLSMLIIGGSETFPKVLANCVYRLHQHPDQRAELVRNNDLIPEAFRELLRYDMPTQFLGRVLKKDFELHGEKLREGQAVLFLYPSGNRDDREFENPDRIDIKRNPQRILSFGHGTHACVGQHVARLEGKICLEALLKHMPDYEVETDRLQRLKTEFVQGFESMPVTFKPFKV